ncbi:MAG TPA: carboxypeptidase regulatory-like domain-containing protein [Gemmatimonadaceae bacterium]|nr:carboxypeptidase regulatory-like domain-containing protein [Gemmatimonadaceae bacterium]HRQ78536.1 carboxypeptidase regulatory-like domain-containing protein [Gemmatimonadaceae bacterium]
MGHWTMRRAAMLLGVVSLGATALPAQGAVEGRVTITERAGERTEDLGNTIIYLVRNGGASTRPRPADATIAMNGRTFTPRVRVVPVGSKVNFPNQDPFSHNVFSTSPTARFDLGLYPSGRSKDVTFRRAGVVPVYCNIHPRMTSFVLAVETPYFTQVGEDGRWRIAGVPAGEYTVHIWHERATPVERPLTVVASGNPGFDVTLDARGFRFVQHRNKFGREYDRSGPDRY